MPDPSDRKAHPHPLRRPPTNGRLRSEGPIVAPAPAGPGYAELAVTSNFTFLRGASHPDELVRQAASLGHAAVAITDWNSLAGVVRAHVAAKEAGIALVVGCRLVFQDAEGLSLLVYPTDRGAYARLCRLLTLGKRRAPKGECHLTLGDLPDHQQGLLGVVLLSPAAAACAEGDTLAQLRETFDNDRLSLAVDRLYGPDDAARLAQLDRLAEQWCVPLVAVNDVHYHVPQRRVLQDVLTCIRHGCSLAEAGFRLFPHGERCLKPPGEMARLFADRPAALARTLDIVRRAQGFSLDQLRYEYPDETCPAGVSAMAHLRRLTWEGARRHYIRGVPEKVCRQLTHEFALIEELKYAPYFLTVHDLVTFARSRGILCQGRGAAANSAVCFCLGVTAVDPDRIDMLFERFVSRERDEPPDIDIDFEHERREEVIQYIYGKYGRERAGLTAEVITYRRRSAIRDVGKALGFSLDAVDRIAKRVDSWEKNPFADSESGDVPAQLTALGFDPQNATVRRFVALVRELLGFPRHLSQHVGGFVITRGPLCELVPIENAAMENRTVIEWDKDDIEAMGMLKVDVLGLGMLTAIRKCLELVNGAGMANGESRMANAECGIDQGVRQAARGGRENLIGNCQSPIGNWPLRSCLTLATIPAEDPAVYEMIERADTLGVFQIESRAQMTMLPRLKPRCFYDLVIEVAIVRPGPIVGEMVHPYLRRRNGEERFDFPDETIRSVLGKTLGVPLFQEQVMALAIRAAGFTAGEAEKLRRAITAWTSKDDISRFPTRFVEGMVRNGYDRAFAEWCFQRFKGFSQYGFPESHAASFALLVYASCWLKCYYPAAYAAALLNSQPMGFYAPAQIVRDVRDHGVEVRPVDVNHSDWDCTLENSGEVLRDSPVQSEGREHQRHEGTLDTLRQGQASPRSHEGNGESGMVNAECGMRNAERGTRSGASCENDIARSRTALRLGLRMVKGLREDDARAIVAAVQRHGSFAGPFDLWRASGVNAAALQRLARADAFTSMNLDRRAALWEVRRLRGCALPLFDSLPWLTAAAPLPAAPPALEVGQDYATVGLSLKAHPLSFLRRRLARRGVWTAADIKDARAAPPGRRVVVAGIVLFRQRPGTAKGVMFMTIEDETGRVDLIVRPTIYERFRSAAVYAAAVLVRGHVERQGRVVHVLASKLEDLEDMDTALPKMSRDFR